MVGRAVKVPTVEEIDGLFKKLTDHAKDEKWAEIDREITPTIKEWSNAVYADGKLTTPEARQMWKRGYMLLSHASPYVRDAAATVFSRHTVRETALRKMLLQKLFLLAEKDKDADVRFSAVLAVVNHIGQSPDHDRLIADNHATLKRALSIGHELLKRVKESTEFKLDEVKAKEEKRRGGQA